MLLDYYKILECPPNASLAELKKQYRILAKKYHPDINEGNNDALLQFNLIKEAYENLSNPNLKHIYLNKKWYAQSQGQTNFKQTANTFDVILKDIIAIEKFVKTGAAYNTDFFAIETQLKNVLTPVNADYLNIAENQPLCETISWHLQKIFNALPAKHILNLQKELSLFKAINQKEIDIIWRKKNRSEFYENYMLLIIICASCFILGFIFWAI